MVKITLIPAAQIQKVQQANIDKYAKLALIADMCRANTLATVKRAGSGHLGTSFSSLDIVTFLYHAELNTAALGVNHPDRDIFFSSKGHDVPALYAVLYSLGILPQEKFINLRRFGGTHGHPNLETVGIEANSGSLGMGISKGKGMAYAKKLQGRGGRIFVMTGDGELQEGQIYEALQTAAHQGITNLHVIVDNNKVQSDKPVQEIIALGDLETKFRSFGWHVARCNGHDFKQLDQVVAEFKAITDKPKLLIADTIKGCGVSFMEHPTALQNNHGLYPWHAGAPDDKSFEAAYAEIINRVENRLHELALGALELEELAPADKSSGTLAEYNLLGEPVSEAAQHRLSSKVSDEYVAIAFGEALVKIGAERQDLVVLDGDLAADCRIRKFEKAYSERFIENGIAEQDMVSMAGGLARQGLLPVVNSFASFLAARANEQIYNNASERSKIIYACHYAGLIPAGPGFSHQSIRDISLFGALPNCLILQPCNAAETYMAVDYCINQTEETSMIRLVIGPSPRIVRLPEGYQLTFGQGVVVREGTDAVIFTHGPVMLHEAMLASELLEERSFSLKVVNMPWLNRVDQTWLREMVAPHIPIYTLEDHAPYGGLGDCLLNALANSSAQKLTKFAVEGYPACGTPVEALRFHKLDGLSVANRILHQADKAE